ncbi:Uncharacterised protein [Klebsiella pneumoniae]|nr:Uncharacterised protein [Klebsiella pneumoniae]
MINLEEVITFNLGVVTSQQGSLSFFTDWHILFTLTHQNGDFIFIYTILA